MSEMRTNITALFENENQAAEAVRAVRGTQWPIKDVHGPIPSEAISEALEVKKSGVGWFTLAGGIIGFFTGYLLAVFTAARWGLIVGGKPVLAYIPFFIVGFEFTILFSVLGNVVGLILLARLPAYRDLQGYPPECSGSYFGVVVDCGADEQDAVHRFLTGLGGRVTVPAPGENGS
ncbi:MAG: DUF3341 domain-containing protein [Desulfobacteraceae bacterium]|nr:DUF3341 domain-containing protein [Desulfobacteraceae bacterium]